MNSSEYLVASSLLCSIGSAIPDCLLITQADVSAEDILQNPPYSRGGGSIEEISLDRFRTSEHEGFLRPSDKTKTLFSMYDRQTIEECMYRTFGENRSFLVPARIRKMVAVADDLPSIAATLCYLELSGDSSEIKVDIKSPGLSTLVLSRTLRVIDDFNQVS